MSQLPTDPCPTRDSAGRRCDTHAPAHDGVVLQHERHLRPNQTVSRVSEKLICAPTRTGGAWALGRPVDERVDKVPHAGALGPPPEHRLARRDSLGSVDDVDVVVRQAQRAELELETLELGRARSVRAARRQHERPIQVPELADRAPAPRVRVAQEDGQQPHQQNDKSRDEPHLRACAVLLGPHASGGCRWEVDIRFFFVLGRAPARRRRAIHVLVTHGRTPSFRARCSSTSAFSDFGCGMLVYRTPHARMDVELRYYTGCIRYQQVP